MFGINLNRYTSVPGYKHTRYMGTSQPEGDLDAQTQQVPICGRISWATCHNEAITQRLYHLAETRIGRFRKS